MFDVLYEAVALVLSKHEVLLLLLLRKVVAFGVVLSTLQLMMMMMMEPKFVPCVYVELQWLWRLHLILP
jgi:hypothetical protein